VLQSHCINLPGKELDNRIFGHLMCPLVNDRAVCLKWCDDGAIGFKQGEER